MLREKIRTALQPIGMDTDTRVINTFVAIAAEIAENSTDSALRKCARVCETWAEQKGNAEAIMGMTSIDAVAHAMDDCGRIINSLSDYQHGM